MNFQWTREQLDLKNMIAEFIAKEVTPYAGEMDEAGQMKEGLQQKFHELGLLNLLVPEAYGGPGMDTLTVALLYEELGKGCAGVATSIATNALAVHPLLLAGTEAQKERFFGALNAGKLAAFAMTEAGAGSDAGGVATRAVKDGKHYVLNGAKSFVTNGSTAEMFVVFANTRKAAGVRGLTAFLVEKGASGFSTARKAEKMGIRASDTCGLVFRDVHVTSSQRIGREGEGFKIAMKTVDAARPLVGAIAVGIAQAAMDAAVRYAKERLQFDRPVASFQLVQSMLADMAMQIEAARLLVHKACWLQDQGMSFAKEAAMAKCFASDVAMKVTVDAVQVMGGYGYSKDYSVEKYMRDAKIMQIFEGTNQIQRLVIANAVVY